MNKENDKLSFVYSFNMGNDIAHFKLFPDQVKSAAECNVVDVIYESFVVTGDHDYVMSRLLALNGLHRGFYWAAAQTIEKYLKAFLLMNGEDIRGFKGHPLKKLFQAACKIDVTLKDLDIQPHPVIHIENTCTHLVKKFIIFEFISEVEKYGGPNNRYNSTGVEFNTGHLFALDSFAYKLRGMIGAVSIEKSLSKISPNLCLIFNKNNPWFNNQKKEICDEIPNLEFPIQDSISVTKLDFLIKNKDNPAYNAALQWLKKKMQTPKNF